MDCGFSVSKSNMEVANSGYTNMVRGDDKWNKNMLFILLQADGQPYSNSLNISNSKYYKVLYVQTRGW